MKKPSSFLKIMFAITSVFASSAAFAKIEVSFRSTVPAIGAYGSNGAGTKMTVIGTVKKVNFGMADLDNTAKKQNVVVVTVNESELPSGDIGTDAIYFSGADTQLGLSLAGAIGKKMTVNRDGSFTVE